MFRKKPEWSELPDRKLVSNIRDPEIPTNKISTNKYNFITFLPKNLIE